MVGILKRVFGSKHDKDVKQLRPIVDQINSVFESLNSLSHDELRGRTANFRQRVTEAVEPLNTEELSIRNQLTTDSDLTHTERSNLYARLNDIDAERFNRTQDTLNGILPEAYAVVKEACRRLVGHAYTVVDQHMIWDMVPYDVQLIGGIVLHEGKITEMSTGEGKTLVATLPLYLNALAGRGVHLVTVNDYLARRDREWMQPIFDLLGISTGCIQSNMAPAVRSQEYQKDITYGTNNEFGFDYLRDNMVVKFEDMVQRGHWFAIVDEVDSVLIDEARTPLIISGPVASGVADQAFVSMNSRVKKLVDQQSRLVTSLVAEVERLLKEDSNKKENRQNAGMALLRAYRGMPKHGRLMKLLQEADNLKLMKETELEYLKEQGTRMRIIDEELYFTIDERNHQIDISDKGRDVLSTANEDVNMFIIPDITTEMSALEGDGDISPEEKQLKKDEIMRTFADRSDRIHIINQLLRAYTLYNRDDEYVVQDGKVKIVDEFTGRILEGRRYSDGLHQAIEAKESVSVEQDTQTYATVTLQNYFRQYHKLAGMTGTAETEAAEFYQIYKLDVVVIPTNKSIMRKDLNDLIFRTKREKYNAVVESVKAELEKGRAVLVGTTSVEVSEVLSKMLRRAGVNHNVLNAKQHQREAEIVAAAGRRGAVTIATNMAGRGTDIKLDATVKESGGLAIVGTERHESRRIDRQLRGRAGRQGDPGSSQFFISLEDDLMRLFNGDRIASVMTRMKVPEGEPIESSMVTKSVEGAQKKVESNNFSIRKRLLEYDNVMNQQREVIYDRRRHALMGERLRGDMLEYVSETIEDFYTMYHAEADATGYRNAIRASFLCEPLFTDEEFETLGKAEIVKRTFEAATEFYERKEETLGSEYMSILERYATLQSIDDLWREHLRGMDDLKEGIYLRAYGQKDPILEYKQEAYKIFIELIRDINKQAVQFTFKYFPQISQSTPSARAQQQARERITGKDLEPRSSVSTTRQLSFSHPSVSPVANDNRLRNPSEQPTNTVKNEQRKMGRNEPCPLDPSKKFKNCCGAEGHRTCVKTTVS